MALENLLNVYPCPGESDGATTKGYFGKFNGDGEIAQIAALDDIEDGVLTETVTAGGEAVGLKMFGRVSLVAGESVSIGNRVSPGANGKAYVNPNGRWKALSAASADGEFSAIKVAAGPFYAQIDIAANASTGVQESWQNPTGAAILVTRLILDVTTKSSGAATLDIGYTATDATTTSDTGLDGVDVGTATGTFDNIEDQGTNGKSTLKMAAGKWITVDHKADTTALVGTLTIEYIFA